jgi:oligoribonuclease
VDRGGQQGCRKKDHQGFHGELQCVGMAGLWRLAFASATPRSAGSMRKCVNSIEDILMALNPTHLLWLDMEMTGLSPDSDRIIELAIVVTDADLNTVAEGPVLVVHQPDEVMNAMDNWNKGTHGKSGLIDRVKASQLNEAEAETQMLEFVKQHVPARTSPMCGNSICQDRRFLARYMPQLEAFFHYRNLDVSTLKELAKRWRPGLSEEFKKSNKHEALADIYESIDEMKYYREHFIRSA